MFSWNNGRDIYILEDGSVGLGFLAKLNYATRR